MYSDLSQTASSHILSLISLDWINTHTHTHTHTHSGSDSGTITAARTLASTRVSAASTENKTGYCLSLDINLSLFAVAVLDMESSVTCPVSLDHHRLF